jgi:hypothetical protein
MADIIRVAYRKLGGDAETPAATPPWFLPGAEVVWRDIVAVERALRGLVRDVYSSRFAEAAAARIEQALPDSAREPLARALRSRPAGAEPLSIVDYLYLGQLPPLLFSGDVWQLAQERLGSARDLKQRLQVAIGVITPVRNEIAHVREIDPDRLLRAKVACNEILSLFDVEARR